MRLNEEEQQVVAVSTKQQEHTNTNTTSRDTEKAGSQTRTWRARLDLVISCTQTSHRKLSEDSGWSTAMRSNLSWWESVWLSGSSPFQRDVRSSSYVRRDTRFTR